MATHSNRDEFSLTDADDDREKEHIAGEDDGEQEGEEDRGDAFESGDEEQEQEQEGQESEEVEEGDEQEGRKVPYARFAEKVAENARLMDLVATMAKGGAPTPKEKEPPAEPAYDFKAKRKEYQELLLNGETDKALELYDEMEVQHEKALEKRLVEAEERGAQRAIQLQTQRETAEAVAQTWRDYPFLDDTQGNKAFRPEALGACLGLMEHYEKQGLSRAQAMLKAAKEISPLYGKPKKPAQEQEAPPRKPAETGKKGETNLERLKRNVSAANRQAPHLGAAGRSGRSSQVTAADLATMSDEDYNKMSEAEKKKLRGDDV